MNCTAPVSVVSVPVLIGALPVVRIDPVIDPLMLIAMLDGMSIELVGIVVLVAMLASRACEAVVIGIAVVALTPEIGGTSMAMPTAEQRVWANVRASAQELARMMTLMEGHLRDCSVGLHVVTMVERRPERKGAALQIQAMSVTPQPVEVMLVRAACCWVGKGQY